MPRAADATATANKWRGWILAAHGHGPEWARVFRVGPIDSERLWQAIAAAVLDAPVSTIRDRGPHGIVCGVEVVLTINERTARIRPRGTTPTKRRHHASSPPIPARNMSRPWQ